LLGITKIPGGPHLEKLASRGDPKAYSLPLPLSNAKDLAVRNGADFSFAGLKTAVRALCQKHLPKQEEAAAAADGTDGDTLRANIAACFQSRAVQHLSQRVERALRWAKEASEQAGTPLQGMVVAGGVAANKSVRAELSGMAARHGVTMFCPPPRLCVDNGVMVAWSGVERLALDLWEAPPTDLEKVELFVEVRPRWPLGPRDPRSRDKPQMKPHPKQQKKKGGGKRARDKEGSDGAKKAKGASADGAS